MLERRRRDIISSLKKNNVEQQPQGNCSLLVMSVRLILGEWRKVAENIFSPANKLNCIKRLGAFAEVCGALILCFVGLQMDH